MRFARSFLFAAAFACIAFSSAAAAAQRAPMPRLPEPPPGFWLPSLGVPSLFGADPFWPGLFMSDPMLSSSQMMSSVRGQVDSMMRENQRDLNRMAADQDDELDDLGEGDEFDEPMLAAPMAGGFLTSSSSSQSAYSYSTSTDERGCTRSQQMSQQNYAAPQVTAQTSGNCAAPRAR